jgi:LAS superfamily LD-carboxypeptidase LdcB
MSIETITALIVAVIGSGGISTVITTILSAKKHRAETDQLRQQICDAQADTKIKIDEHIHKQMLEITETYKREFENRSDEINELREQNERLTKQVKDLNDQINQLMSWVVYDSMRYQEWLERELLQKDPNIQFPTFRKPPKFVQKYMDEYDDAPDTPPQGFTENMDD